MIRDCLEAFYTPQEKLEVADKKADIIAGSKRGHEAIEAYIKANPPTDGKRVTIPADYVNAAFSDYNEAVSAWEALRKPVILRYAEGKSAEELIQDAKTTLRGIRWKDLEHHPFSKLFLSDYFTRETDMIQILVQLLQPQALALNAVGADDAKRQIDEAIIKKCRRIEATLNKAAGYSVQDQLEGQETMFQERSVAARAAAASRDLALEQNATISLGGHVTVLTSDELASAFTGRALAVLPNDISDSDISSVFDASGKLITLAVGDKVKFENVGLHNVAFESAIMRMVLATVNDHAEITFNIPAIFRELHIDPRPFSGKRNDGSNADMAELYYQKLIDIVSPYERFIGTMPNGDHYRMLSFKEYKRDSQCATLIAPYFFKLKEKTLELEAERRRRQYSSLLHSSVGSEVNQAAVQLYQRIEKGLSNRGDQPNAVTYKSESKKTKQVRKKTDSNGNTETVTTYYAEEKEDPKPTTSDRKPIRYEVKFSKLIKDCDLVGKALADIEQSKEITNKPQAYNTKLKQIFEAAYRIIMEKSDIPQKWINFQLPTMQRTVKGKKMVCYDVPTKSTLGRRLVITHNGKNPDFSQS